MAEKTCRAGIGLRPAPALRWYLRSPGRFRAGTSGSILLHNASDTVQDLICAILSPIFAQIRPPPARK
jgi:hypothetical protein